MPGVVPQVLSTMSFKQLLMHLTSLVRIGWLTQGSTCLLLCDAGNTGACHRSRILSGLWVLNSSPCACTLSSWQPAELSLQSRKTTFFFSKEKAMESLKPAPKGDKHSKFWVSMAGFHSVPSRTVCHLPVFYVTHAANESIIHLPENVTMCRSERHGLLLKSSWTVIVTSRNQQFEEAVSVLQTGAAILSTWSPCSAFIKASVLL